MTFPKVYLHRSWFCVLTNLSGTAFSRVVEWKRSDPANTYTTWVFFTHSNRSNTWRTGRVKSSWKDVNIQENCRPIFSFPTSFLKQIFFFYCEIRSQICPQALKGSASWGKQKQPQCEWRWVSCTKGPNANRKLVFHWWTKVLSLTKAQRSLGFTGL